MFQDIHVPRSNYATQAKRNNKMIIYRDIIQVIANMQREVKN